MTNKTYKAVVFDMDGVIFDSEAACLACWRDLAEKHHIKNMEENFRKCTGTTMEMTRRIMMDAYGPDFNYDEFAREASSMFHERYDDGRLPLKPGVHEILSSLKEKGIRCALASSTRKSTVEKELTDAGLLSYFDEVIGGDMVKRSKPQPDIFLYACEMLHVKPNEAYGIEDSYNGIRALHAAGMKPIMVPDLLPPSDEMKQLSEAILDDLFLVKKYLFNE